MGDIRSLLGRIGCGGCGFYPDDTPIESLAATEKAGK
jgi:hypothetical protein